MKNYLDIDEQIEQNTKRLEFYYSSYQKTQSKVSILVLIYSLIAVYILQVLKYPFTHYTDKSIIAIVFFIMLLILLIIHLVWSIKFTYLLLKPVEVAFLNNPSFFYKEIRKQYEEKLATTNEIKINAYIKATFVNELEISVIRNSKVFELKSKYYDKAFKKGLITLIFYILCSGFIVFEPTRPTDFNINNYREIANTIDSINIKNNFMKKEKIIDEEKEKKDSTTEEFTIDPDLVIKTEPKMVLESFIIKDNDKESIPIKEEQEKPKE